MRELTPKIVSVSVPAGKYVLGDPCYAVPQELWSDACDTSDCFTRPIGIVSRDGTRHKVLGFSTKWGDGVYRGSNGFEYGVDAGLIGLVPWELAKDNFDPDLSTIIEFDRDVVVTNEDGYMNFNFQVIIETNIDSCLDEDEE
jgi:hypothetical protein